MSEDWKGHGEEFQKIREKIREKIGLPEECGICGYCSNGHPMYCMLPKGHMNRPEEFYHHHGLCGTGSQCTADCVFDDTMYFVAGIT